MCDSSKRNCAMLVAPYDHGDSYDETRGLHFPRGRRKEYFGQTYAIDCFDRIRNGAPLP